MTNAKLIFILILSTLAFGYKSSAQCDVNADATYCIDATPVELHPFPPGGTLTGPGVSVFTGSGFNFNPGASPVGTISLDYTFDKKYYVDKSGTFAPEDISTTGTDALFGNYDDGVTGALPIGFSFEFFGTTYTDFYLSTNGVLRFVSGNVNAFNANLVISSQTTYMAQSIAFLWDDWDNDLHQGTIKYETIGVAPNRILIIDYTNISHYNNDLTKPANVQLKLFETTNIIEVHNSDSYTSSATQGIKGADNGEVIIPTDAYVDPNYGYTYYNQRYNTDWGYGGNAVNDYVAFVPHADCSISVDVEILPLPVVNAGLDQEICLGEFVTLSGSGAVSYSWNRDVTDGVPFQPTTTLNYTVTGTGANGCTKTDVVRVTVKELPVIAIEASSTSICPREMVTLNATGDATFEWDNSVTNNVAFAPTATTTYTVTGTGANLCQTTDQITITVNPEPVVTASSTSTDINGGESVTLTGSGATTYSWDNDATDGNPIVPMGTTTYTVTGENEFGCTDTDQITINVTPSSQTITFDALSEVKYDNGDFALTGTTSSGLVPTYTSSNEGVATVVDNVVTIHGVGTTTITASQLGDANYYAAIEVPQSLTVIKGNQTITFDALADVTYGDATFDLLATTDSGLDVTYASSDENVATISGHTVTIVGAGTTTISASQVGDANYNAASDVVQSLTVNKADQTITFDALADVTYGDATFDLLATTDSGLDVTYASSDENVATISGHTVTIVGAGTTTISASQVGDANYNAASDVVQSLTVNKADQTITFDALADVTYGDTSFNLSVSTDSGLDVTYVSSDENMATISGHTVTIVGAGTTTITASQAGDANYNAASDVVQSLTVNKADQAITFDALADVTYGDATFDLLATTDSGLDVTYVSSDENVATISGHTVTIVGAGTTTITASQAGDANYNAASDVVQSLTINKADQIVTFDAIPSLGIGETHSLIASSTSGLEVMYTSSNEGIASINNGDLSIHQFGEVIITASNGGDTNYNGAESVAQTITISTITGSEADISTMDIRTYPNPVVGILTLALGNTSYRVVEVYNTTGHMVYQQAVNVEQQNLEIDMNTYHNGMYIVMLKGESVNKTIRIVKK